MAKVRALVATAAARPAHLDLVEEDDLGPGEVLIEVSWSSLNYKDALAISAAAPVIRGFPAIVGIDLAGVVRSCSTAALQPGDAVAVTGCGLGEAGWRGGLAARARVPASWCHRLEGSDRCRWAMAFGTAGVTAAMAVAALERHGALFPGAALQQRRLPILVTGAAGGVGSIALALLARLGAPVVALTGRLREAERLQGLGAVEVIGREVLFAGRAHSLSSERFAGAVDVVGGPLLAAVLAAIARSGAVAACGLAGGADLPTSVYPFILRSVSLLGIDSARAPAARRAEAWALLARLLPDGLGPDWVRVVPFGDLQEPAADLLAGRVRGRLVVEMAG